MPKMVEVKNWRNEPVTRKQFNMMNWLLNKRGIICDFYNTEYTNTAYTGYNGTKSQASRIIDSLLSHSTNDEIIELLENYKIKVVRREKRKRSWQELVAEDVFSRF